MKKVIELRNVSKQFDGETVLDSINLDIYDNEFLTLLGPSGCGKTTTLRMIGGFETPDQGDILFLGERINDIPPHKRNINTVFQRYALFPHLDVYDNIAFGLRARGIYKQEKNSVDEFIEMVGLKGFEQSYPHQLSGGLRQRVMIGMAMVCNPDLLIADEPTTALDVTIEAQILHLMRQLQKDKGTSIMMITHNLGVVAEICDQVYVMYAGKVVESAEVHELFQNPKHPYTQGLLGALPKMDSRQRLNSIDGMVPTLKDMPTGCRFAPRCPMATQKCREEQPALVDVTAEHQVRCFMSCSK